MFWLARVSPWLPHPPPPPLSPLPQGRERETERGRPSFLAPSLFRFSPCSDSPRSLFNRSGEFGRNIGPLASRFYSVKSVVSGEKYQRRFLNYSLPILSHLYEPVPAFVKRRNLGRLLPSPNPRFYRGDDLWRSSQILSLGSRESR